MLKSTKLTRNLAKLMLCAVFFTLTSCIDEKITGYLVAKEYTPERMCCDGTETICYAGFTPVSRTVFVPHTHHHTHHHHSKRSAEYYWFIANKKEVIKKRVSPKLFYSKKLGTKVTMKR
jgi:hypothetical protein